MAETGADWLGPFCAYLACGGAICGCIQALVCCCNDDDDDDDYY
jgi:hypothetical protein